jgi:cytochrome c2
LALLGLAAALNHRGTLPIESTELLAQEPASRGAELFAAKCVACHSVGEGKKIGPDLKDVSTRHSNEWIKKFTENPQAMKDAKDPDAVKLFEEFAPMVMAPQGLSDTELDAILGYIAEKSKSAASTETHGPTGQPANPQDKDLWPYYGWRGIGESKGYMPEQPIAYSHKLHAGALKIDCRYCHFAAEKSRHAGIPPVSVCINCHQVVKRDSPEVQKILTAYKENKAIEWVKVHNLPDHVQFNHSVHVNAGVDCLQCHGDVPHMVKMRQAKKLTMGECIGCHRAMHQKNPALRNNPNQLLDCANCHH